MSSNQITKRRILSEIAQLFDQLGWLSPVIVLSKILMQNLWKEQTGWDDPVSQSIATLWSQYKEDLHNINNITIPRCIVDTIPSSCELGGFCDASEKAYGAVVYLLSHSSHGGRVALVTSKTRVAPSKTISLPRLELCGASLLAQLISSVKKALKLPEDTAVRAWSDSTVVLAWIKSHPSRWKTFVANRVTTIQELIPSSCWYHVPGTENPADICSCGLFARDLVSSSLWWDGPSWLLSSSRGPSSPIEVGDENLQQIKDAERNVVVVTAALTAQHDLSLLYRYSDLTHLTRITAWILRFTKNCKPQSARTSGPLTPAELRQALHTWIKITQSLSFHQEIYAIKYNKPLSKSSQILSLNPFLDSDSILRVGGRLRNATKISSDQRNPILLPRHSQLTELLIRSLHLRHLHAGPTLLMSISQQHYWILRVRDAVRFQIRRCVTCTRHKAITQQQLMGDLPASRVNPSYPFQRCGVDYAGPFLLRPDIPRSKVSVKAYLALFVCFSTRACHLELVSSLSTDGFLAALRRFVARRGKPTDIHSDCGTNFVGANKELQELKNLAISQTHNDLVAKSLAGEGIKWHFNPPGSPHFGGIWESGVKSVKFHLRRICGSARLTFEELATIFAQVEACLNSRPLTPFSNEPSDLNVLTSGHFLIGQPLLAVPEPNLTTLPENRLSRWQLVQSLQQQFWKRWSSEYLSRLQQRHKWLQQKTNLKVDDIVLIKDENLPPLKWNLGRITSLHPAADNKVRAVTLRTMAGSLQRPIHKLCLLPIINSQ